MLLYFQRSFRTFLSTAELGYFGNGSYTRDSKSKFNLCRYSKSSNTTVPFPLSVYSILINVFRFTARMLLSSLLITLGTGDFDLSNMDLIFQLKSISIDGKNFGITDSTAHIVPRLQHGYDTAKYKPFFTTVSSV